MSDQKLQQMITEDICGGCISYDPIMGDCEDRSEEDFPYCYTSQSSKESKT